MRNAHRNPRMTHAITKSQRAVLALILAATFPAISRAQDPGQKTYPSAEAASQALADAAAKNDVKAMLEVLGPQGKKIISSGDPAQDQENRSHFADRYKAMHRLVTEPDGTTTLYIGAENWPTPIPLVEKEATLVFRHRRRQRGNSLPPHRQERTFRHPRLPGASRRAESNIIRRKIRSTPKDSSAMKATERPLLARRRSKIRQPHRPAARQCRQLDAVVPGSPDRPRNLSAATTTGFSTHRAKTRPAAR